MAHAFGIRKAGALLAQVAMLVAASNVFAATEEVLVYKVLGSGDEGIIVRGNGDAYQIEKGVGCLGLREGRKVLIVSPGLFLGIGSKILIPERDQECRIWDSTPLGNLRAQQAPSNSRPAPQIGASPLPIQADSVGVAAAQAALRLLGYGLGPVDGAAGEQTRTALARFQAAKGLNQSGRLDNPTRLALATELSTRFPEDSEILTIVRALLGGEPAPSMGRSAARSGGCEEGHWLQSVSSGGGVLILEDGSVWEVDAIDQIDTGLWLPTEEVIVCGTSMINTDNGEKVGVRRLK